MGLDERRRRLLIWGVVLVLVAAGLLWFLFYGVRLMRENWMRANEAEARQTLGALTGALKVYHDRHEGYPDSLERLRGAEDARAAAAPPERAQLLDTELAKDSFEQDGYRFTYERGQRQQRWAATVPLYSSYQLKAEPLKAGQSGEWFYYSDQGGEIRGKQGDAAGPDDPVIK